MHVYITIVLGTNIFLLPKRKLNPYTNGVSAENLAVCSCFFLFARRRCFFAHYLSTSLFVRLTVSVSDKRAEIGSDYAAQSTKTIFFFFNNSFCFLITPPRAKHVR